jgi:prolyl 4-hydroxylase
MSDHETRRGGPREAAQLGLRFLTADGVPPDPARGVALIERAAQAGDPEACFLAATLASSSLWQARDWDGAFDYLLRAAESDHKPSQDSLRVLAGGPSGHRVDGEDWGGMRGEIDMAAWLEPGIVEVIRQAPHIQCMEKFIPAAACDWLVARARARLERATIYNQVTGGAIEDERRTNSQCDLGVEASGVLTFVLRARLSVITGRPEQAMEIPKILHYQPGETFTEHCDYLDPATPAFQQELSRRGQRCATFLIYLNDDFAGGETFFSKIDLAYKGAKGDALLFANIDAEGVPDSDTEHAGLPPTTGEKWLFSQWIRDIPAVAS